MSINGVPIRIVLVGGSRDARWLRELFDSDAAQQFCVTRAPNPESVDAYLSGEHADVVLLDLEASQGREYLEAARAIMPSVPVIVLSENDDESLALECLQHGAQDFLVKTRLDRSGLARSLSFAIERHRLQKRFQSLSLLDDLTGLNNRRGFLTLAQQHLRLILRKGAALLIYLDVDNLKTINDTYGHTEGNHALVVTADVLRSCFRQSDILARLGGDEFCVLMTDASTDSAHNIRRRLQEHVETANTASPRRFRLSLSVGIAEVPTVHQPALEDLLSHADSVMYEQKRSKSASAPAGAVHTILS